MTSSTLLHENFRAGYATMSLADLDQQADQTFAFSSFDPLEDFIVDTDLLKLETLMDDSSLDLDFNIYTPHPSDSIFDHAVDPFIYPLLRSDPLCFPPPPPLPLNPPSNQQGPSPGLIRVLQDSFVELRKESPYINIPTVVQESLSEDEEEEDDDDEAAAAAEAESGYGQRHQLNASTHKFVKIPRTTTCTTAKTIPAAPRRVRRRKDQLWYFLLETLGNPKYNPHFIQWENKDLGIFRFIQSKKVAQLWGAKKNRSNMSYEYFARAMRHYYSRGIMHRVAGRRLVYQFGPKAENWKNYAQLVAISACTSSSPVSSSSTSSSSSLSSSVNANSVSTTNPRS